MITRKLIVLAANGRMFEHWRSKCRVRQADAIYITQTRQLRGMQLEAWQVIRYENYWEHPKHQDLELLIAHMTRPDATPDTPRPTHP